MTAIISRDIFDSSNLTIVPVIASFDANGNVRPLYLGADGESYKIRSAVYVQEACFRKYRCEVEANGYIRNVILLYHPSKCAWAIPR